MVKIIKNLSLWLLIMLLRVLAKRSKKNKEHILILSNTAMGDTLWASAALQYLHEVSPETRVTVLTSVIGGQALLNNPYIHEIWIDQKSMRSKFKNFIAILRTSFSETFNFHTSKRFISYVGFLGSPGKYFGIYPECKARSILNGGINSPEFDKLHKIQMRINLLQRFLKLPEPVRKYSVKTFYSGEMEVIDSKYPDLQSMDNLVFIQPGASILGRRWHGDNFREVVRWLSTHNYQCVFAGNEQEQALIDYVSDGVENVIKLGKSQSLAELSYIIQQCRFIVTNDTGPMHLAESLNIPIFCFFPCKQYYITSNPITTNYVKNYIAKDVDHSLPFHTPSAKEVITDIQNFLDLA